MDEKERKRVLIEFGGKNEEVEELLEYNRNVFYTGPGCEGDSPGLSEDESFTEVWREYINEAETKGAFNTLKTYFPQLNFPILQGISQTPEYRSAVLKGVSWEGMTVASGLMMENPEALSVYLYPSCAGRIPVLFTSSRADFKTLVGALSMKNEPMDIPDSTGAFFVKGFNNWDRIKRYREKWEKAAGTSESEPLWPEEFKRLVPQKHLYQDKFIILSDGPYSGISGEVLGFSEDEWNSISLVIRREHECTHYFTQRAYGFARNNVFDEIIADYAGIVKAAGIYKARWFLNFVGLENYPKYRSGARLENYRGNPPLSDGAWTVLQRLVWQAAYNLEKLNEITGNKPEKQALADILGKLSGMTLEEMAVSRDNYFSKTM